MNLHGLSDSVGGMIESPAKCRQCGATTRLGNGLCLSCTLREGLQDDRESSRESFDAILAEDEVQDTHWRVGNYEILEEIGRGGMGVIYRARQRHSRRIVALKRMVSYHADSRETLERFRREAEAAASLDDPNILPIYEVGHGEDGLPFFSMKYAAGGSLQKAGPALRGEPRECVRLMAKVARAVQYAHEHGILHRDLKPGNILLDGHGEPFVTDFGLAKWLDASTDLTRTLTIFGTPGYIAPEQAKGPAAKLTPAADVYSLGALLFDLFTGRPPFLGEHALAVIQQASEKPAPKLRSLAPALDRDLETICARCLEREPQARYRSAGDLASDLERWLEGRPIIARRVSPPVRALRWSKRNPKLAAATAATFCSAMAAAFLFFSHYGLAPQSGLDSRLPPEKSIAVLPFENLSRDPDNAYFAEGVQDEILTRLAAVRDLKVISRTSTAKYQSKPDNLKRVAQELGVSTILEGAVQKAGDKVRVNVQLIDARADTHLWAKSYDRDLKDVLKVEAEVSQEIADALQANLSPSESHVLTSVRTYDPEAYDLFLRGEYALHQADISVAADAYDGADAFYRKALTRDPNFAEAAAELARSRLYRHWFVSPLAPAELNEVKSIIDRALALAPNSPEAHFALGLFFYFGHRHYEMALTEFNRTLELQPNNADVRAYCAWVYRRRGEWERSLAESKRAEELDPRDAQIPTNIGVTYIALRWWKDAERAATRALAIDPHKTLAAVALISSRLYGTGDADSTRRALDDFPEVIKSLTRVWYSPGGDVASIIGNWVYLDVMERRFTDAFQAFEKEVGNDDHARLQQLAGRAALRVLAGQADAAKSAGEEALPLLEARLRQRPDDTFAMTWLSWVYLALGRNADALRLSRQAADSISIENDALSGPSFQSGLAQIEARTGAPEEAIKRLRRLLSIPAGHVASIARLRIDPAWDPVRNRPDFQQLLSGPEQIGYSSSAPATTASSAPAQIPEKSIAVLPFENLSRDPDNAYFAEGIQDEILTRLSKIADLKVISRTSTQHYKSAPTNLPETAKQLGVAHILEGSVQKSGDAVRVNVQLIKAASDSHLWADTFDRKLTDIFSVESEVAKAIADQLQAKLTGLEEQVIAAKPTDNTEAYDAYLRGLAYSLKTANTTANALNAQKYLREAVRLDPKFALAWALLSFVDARGYRTQFLQPTVALRDEAWQAAETALSLQPNLGEAILAKGFYYYACLKDYDTAVRYFEEARPLMPNSSRIPESLAYVTRKQGQWDKSESYFDEAERLDPRNVSLLTQHALSYKDRRLFPEAWRKLEQIVNITPDDVDTIVEKAVIAQAEGDLPRASALLASVQPATDDTNALETQVYQSILERRPAQIISRLKELLAKPDPALGFYKGELRFWLGWAQEIGNDRAAAQESWRQARSELESFLKEQPENHILLGDLALTNVSLGDKSAALALSEQGMTVNPIEKDALVGPASIEFFARMAAQTGEADRAIAALQKLLSIPYAGPLGPGAPLTPALLRLDPMFDPLRNDPRFQKLAATQASRDNPTTNQRQ